MTITAVITHSGTIEVDAESEEEAEARISDEGGYIFEDLGHRKADVFLDIESVGE